MAINCPVIGAIQSAHFSVYVFFPLIYRLSTALNDTVAQSSNKKNRRKLLQHWPISVGAELSWKKLQ